MRKIDKVLSLRGVSKRYGSALVVDHISMDVAAGELVVLLGPSGAGKSTIFRCISQLVRPDSGEVILDGQRLDTLHGKALRAQRKKIGLVFQQFNLVSRLSALQNVLLGRLGHMPGWKAMLGLFDQRDRQLALRSLDRVGLLHKAYQRADTLSGGQQQRVAIARTLAQESRLLLADEPVASLDPSTSRQVLNNLKQAACENGIGILCSLHQVDLALEFADRVIAVSGGRIVLDSFASDLDVNSLASVYESRAVPGTNEQAVMTTGFSLAVQA